MNAGNALFIVGALLCLVGALSTVIARSPIRAAMGLLITIIGIASLFLKLSAQFLAAIQIIVYAGAVVVLFVFVIMLIGADTSAGPPKSGGSVGSRIVAGGGMAVLSGLGLLLLARFDGQPVRFGPAAVGHGDVEAVGGLLFREAIIPFELATALLIVAVIGAIAVARSKARPRPAPPESHESKRLFHGPLHPRDAQRPLSKEPAE
ncbi:MAG: NADH-quinone oxidoreductase subunit J [Polyangiaceae bacterium]|nr:NADH-quinone oxidoreductase subunit J [Polyangiaceae bacterium]